MKAAFFFAFLAPAAACFADIDLAGTWRVEGEGLSGELTLPGTLGDAKLGTRWTRADFERTLDKPQSGALTLEHQYLGRAVYTRTFAYDIRLAEPVTGTVELTFSNPEGLFRTGRVLVDGHVHDLPSVKGDYVARIGIIREDMLDGKLELRASCMTGPDLVLQSIRVVRSD